MLTVLPLSLTKQVFSTAYTFCIFKNAINISYYNNNNKNTSFLLLLNPLLKSYELLF